MDKVKVIVGKIIIPTYPEPAAEEMPMFAENRVHQRTSGRPYPNKVVMQVDRTHKEDKAYTLVTLENEYVKIEILPEIGGRIYSALDKTTGYDYFYKQHVIKPALIGVLGSWISGGVEFNWPFHHRASGFMPCDFKVEELSDGSAVCHLSEHDPIDRMKGMVSVILRPGETSFETRMRLYNRTTAEKSFLWWENAAVPVNEQYQIFFPQDVSYVNFHYLKSRTTYPIAGNGVFNGIPMDTDRDISWHKNTKQATSYFACASDYDFFGGYDHGKECGVVHIGDHHISPGKKMFTWAYCQLSKSWENALTDTDGEYAELGLCYPMRFEEIAILEDVIAKTNDADAKMLLGCLLYSKLHYEKAAELWEECKDNYIAKRNLAVAYFSHLGRNDEALALMKEVLDSRPDDEELLYETVVLMDKMGIDPKEKINLITSHKTSRDDVLTELAKAYNQAFIPEKAIETLMSHDFVPCEGGEHAIADQYMFAYLVMGKTEFESGNIEGAIELFRKGQVLPQSLGAGIWNHCKLIPLKYHEALCLEILNKKVETDEIFSYIANVTIEYFSNMHLKELPYWQAKSFMHLGEPTKAQHIMTKCLREWSKIQHTKDNGYFGTTPFFIPFVDEPQKLRRAQYLYLMSLCSDFAKNARMQRVALLKVQH